jgi:hypothetical protein
MQLIETKNESLEKLANYTVRYFVENSLSLRIPAKHIEKT